MEALKPAELAAELKVSRETLSRWRQKKRGPAWIGVGRAIRYTREAVDAWLAQRAGRKLT